MAELSPRALNRILNLEEDEALALIESAKDIAEKLDNGELSVDVHREKLKLQKNIEN